jgi:DNA-binding MarR family transcriptional regulator
VAKSVDVKNKTARGDQGRGHALSGTSLERASDHNQRVTLHAIRVNAPITRTDLVSLTGLTAPAIANITKRLLQENLIKETGRARGGRGHCRSVTGCYRVVRRS